VNFRGTRGGNRNRRFSVCQLGDQVIKRAQFAQVTGAGLAPSCPWRARSSRTSHAGRAPLATQNAEDSP
jgi:hypothetical protein